MNKEEFIKEWNKKMKAIYTEYKHPSYHYIMVMNNCKGYILAQEYLFSYEDFVLFAVRVNSKQVYTGGEYLKNIKELSISFGWG